MAKSAQSELREIARIEETARRDLERAKGRRAQLVAPLAGKLSSVFSDRVREFLGENIERAVSSKFDRKSFEEKVDAMLVEFFSPEKALPPANGDEQSES